MVTITAIDRYCLYLVQHLFCLKQSVRTVLINQHLKKNIFSSKDLVWILMMKALRPAIPEVSTGPRPPLPCPNCWTDSENAELVATKEMKMEALSLCQYTRQPEPQL